MLRPILPYDLNNKRKIVMHLCIYALLGVKRLHRIYQGYSIVFIIIPDIIIRIYTAKAHLEISTVCANQVKRFQ